MRGPRAGISRPRASSVGVSAGPIDTSTLSNVVALYRANNGYSAGVWEDMAGAESADEATNPPTYSATDAAFGNTPSLTFDGTNDLLTDTRAASSFNFITENTSGTDWVCWAVLSAPDTTVGTKFLACIGAPTGAGSSGLALSRGSSIMRLSMWTNGNLHMTGASCTYTANAGRYLIWGTKSVSGASASYTAARSSGSAYASATATRSANQPAANTLVFGRNPASGTFYSSVIAEFGVAQFALTSAIADGMARYFNQQYGVPT